MSLLEALIDLIGQAPAGYEPIAYVLGGIFAFYFITLMFGVLTALARRR